MKLLKIKDVEKLNLKQVKKIYKENINSSIAKILGSFSFNDSFPVKAEGCYIYFENKKKVLDVTGGIGVLNHGHNNSRILSARINFQKKKKMEVHKLFFSKYTAALSYNISQLFPQKLSKVFLCNSGAEANEGAIKLAYKYFNGKKEKILSSSSGFHGKLIATGSISGNYSDQFTFPKIEFGINFKFNDIRSLIKIEKKLKINNNIFALIIECYSEFRFIDEKFIKKIFELKKKYNFIVIFDEVYTGWGKVGYAFSFNKFPKYVPDIVTFSKSFGGGKSSISGFIANKDIFSKVYELDKNAFLHTTTYNGFGEECLTAIEAINIFHEKNFPALSKKIEDAVQSNFIKIKKKNLKLKISLKGNGALFAINIENPYIKVEKIINKIPIKFIKDKQNFISKIYTASIIDELFKKYNIYSILGDSSLARGKNIIDDRTPILFKPSLIITEKEINYFFNSLEKVLSSNQNILVLKFIKNVIKNL